MPHLDLTTEEALPAKDDASFSLHEQFNNLPRFGLGKPSTRSPEWASFHALLHHSYFERIRVIQEIAVCEELHRFVWKREPC